MRNYEYTLLLSPLLSEDEVTGKVSTIVSTIQEKGGILEKQAILGKKPFHSAAKSANSPREAYLVVLNFMATPDHQESIQSMQKADGTVLRFMGIQKVLRNQSPKSFAATKEKSRPEASETNDTPEQTEDQTRKIDVQDIDTQLDEIFKKEQQDEPK